jgi:hypothetical protein
MNPGRDPGTHWFSRACIAWDPEPLTQGPDATGCHNGSQVSCASCSSRRQVLPPVVPGVLGRTFSNSVVPQAGAATAAAGGGNLYPPIRSPARRIRPW